MNEQKTEVKNNVVEYFERTAEPAVPNETVEFVIGKRGVRKIASHLFSELAELRKQYAAKSSMYLRAVERHFVAQRDLSESEQQRKIMVAAAYANGEIVGKNQTERDAVENEMFPMTEINAAKTAVFNAKMTADLLDMELSMMRENRRFIGLQLQCLEMNLDKTPPLAP